MGSLPWIFVPAFLVPIDLLVHFAIWTRLVSTPRSIGAVAMAG
jgi:hypothetical protein